MRDGSRSAPRRNRVAPTGEIVAIALRGRWLGNRGCLHRGDELVRHHVGRRWIVCETSFRERRLVQWAPGRYTVLFFHDEAVALAAGHRPCAQCRHQAFREFLDAWERGTGAPPSGVAELDGRLHDARRDGGSQRLHRARWSSLPDGVFAAVDGAPCLVRRDALHLWTHAGYAAPARRPRRGTAVVLTPAPTVAAIVAGYVPQIAIADSV